MEHNELWNLDELPAEQANMSTMEWIAEQMPGGFFIYRADDSQEVLFINRAGCHIFGCDTVEEFRKLTGNTFRGMVHPEDFDKVKASIEKQIASDEENQLDYVIYRILRKDGEIRWLDDYGHFANLADVGDVFYVFISDITDTCRIQKERERNRRLKQALEEAEQANKAKTSFLSNMSHEIRTPITAILGMNEIIRRESDDPAILQYSENIRRAGNSLLRIVSDILDFSKIEAGKLEIVEGEYSMFDIIADLYNMIQFRAEEKGLSLQIEVDPALPRRLVGDMMRVKQIITNLLTNAIKYTERGSVTLHITLADRKEETASVYVEVRDTGIGIKEEEICKLFEAFERLDTRRTHTIEGVGLGLPICQQILGMMGSKLQVDSVYNVGSTFYFYLDQEVADAEPIGQLSADDVVTIREDRSSESLSFIAPDSRILIVDDTPMNLQVIEGLLKPTKMQIDTATSGAECLEKFSVYPYDLIFLDYRMPHMDGIETLEELKEKNPEKFEHTPIISLTASAVTGERERMLGAGFTDYLTKPVNMSEMREVLTKYLPDEEIIPIKEEASEEEDVLAELPGELFALDWLDPKEGVEYCGDATMYLCALEMFAKSVDDKITLIRDCLTNKDIKLFTVTVHAIKSTALTIGAAGFSAEARALELASKAEEYEVIHKDTPAFLEEYHALKVDLDRALAGA